MQLRAPGFRAIAIAKWTSYCTSVSFFFTEIGLVVPEISWIENVRKLYFFNGIGIGIGPKEYNYFSCSPVAKNDHMKPSSTMRNVLKRARHYAILASVFSLIQIFLYLFYLYIYFLYVYTSHSWLHERIVHWFAAHISFVLLLNVIS